MAKHKADIISTNHGSIIAIAALSRKGRRWLAENVDATGEQVYCDHRNGVEILLAARDAGLRLQDSTTGRTVHNADQKGT